MGRVDKAVMLIWQSIARKELYWNTVCIDDLVFRPSRTDDGEAYADYCANTFENGLTRSYLFAKEQIELLHF